jgi:hypothetical protein
MRLLRLAKDNYNAGSVLKSSTVERQIFPETKNHSNNVEIEYENKMEMPKFGLDGF